MAAHNDAAISCCVIKMFTKVGQWLSALQTNIIIRTCLKTVLSLKIRLNCFLFLLLHIYRLKKRNYKYYEDKIYT